MTKPTDLAGLSSAELLELAEQVQLAYTESLDREAKARATARERLVAAAGQLRQHLGPKEHRQGNLTCLNAACLLTPEGLADKPAEVLHLLVVSLRDVTRVAEQVVLIGAEQAR
uniref:Uncharacterized protein n=1 Tax=Dulem virus 32 TaxID=3145750 RepID=A0AAU8B3C8_9CAUD